MEEKERQERLEREKMELQHEFEIRKLELQLKLGSGSGVEKSSAKFDVLCMVKPLTKHIKPCFHVTWRSCCDICNMVSK